MTQNHETWVESADPSHLELIGQIITRYARLEALVCAMFWHYTDTGKVIGPAITSQLTMRHITPILIDVVQKTQSNDRLVADIESIKSEIADLAKERNKIAHWEWMLSADGPGITKYYTGKEPVGMPDVEVYSKSKMQQIVDRIDRLTIRIKGHLLSPDDRKKIPKERQDRFAPAPWLDTP